MVERAEGKIKVFVSSTYQDLKEYRNKCIEVLDKLKVELDIDWVGMESFGANDSSPKDYCLRRVEESDMYVGILGMQYGHVDNESGKSVTELEYRAARKLPCMIYLIDEKNALIQPCFVDQGAKADQLREFKRELSNLSRGHVVGSFRSPDDLAAQLAVDLIRGLRMIKGECLTGLRGRVEQAITAGCLFIREMEYKSRGGWAYFSIGEPTCWDTASSLLALVAGDEEGATAQLHRGQRWLIAHRNQHGGWRSPWESNPDASTTMDTAAALLALKESGYDEQPQYLVTTADYLLGAQHPEGGWSDTIGYGPAATAATAWVIRALVAMGLSAADGWAQRALCWLIGQQWPDGGWGTEPWAACTTIGKTCDALMGLSAFGPVQTEQAVERALGWLNRARGAYPTAEEFGRSIGAEPHGVNPTVENILLFLEAAFHARIPPGDPLVKNDLEWITKRRWWSYTPRAVRCLCQYRNWVT